MSEPTLPDQETATLALMMEREVDKRVLSALIKALDPYSGRGWRHDELERKFAAGDATGIRDIMRALFIETVMSDGSLMHQIRSKLAEQLNKPY